jgi:hypothetical protein
MIAMGTMFSSVFVDMPELQVEGVVQLLGEKLAVTVEATIAHTALRGPVVCYDLCKLADKTPNLKLENKELRQTWRNGRGEQRKPTIPFSFGAFFQRIIAKNCRSYRG